MLQTRLNLDEISPVTFVISKLFAVLFLVSIGQAFLLGASRAASARSSLTGEAAEPPPAGPAERGDGENCGRLSERTADKTPGQSGRHFARAQKPDLQVGGHAAF